MTSIDKTERKGRVPEVVLDEDPDLAEFSAFAWESALRHVARREGVPQSPYMDEGFAPNRIWIWDTCFMALFARYAPDLLPGVASLDNFYRPMLDGEPTALPVHIPDNPPLFAWAEWEHYLQTGDAARMDLVFHKMRYPQRMFRLFERFQAGDRMPCQSSVFPVMWEKRPLGYMWTGGRSGMDNTPRGDFSASVFDNDPRYLSVLWIDAISQQALACRIIHEVTGRDIWERRFRAFAETINANYWDEETGAYYDIATSAPHGKARVLTPASFWPLLAGVVPPERARRLAAHLENPDELGGAVPFPSVARNSRHFDSGGRYWRGGVWLPTAYVCVRGLEENGFAELADRLAEQLVRWQMETWRQCEPHTIWECYSPTEPKPATGKFPEKAESGGARPDFCGWSALGPINMVIENIVGIRCDALRRRIEWRLHRADRHGVRHLHFDGGTVSLVFNGASAIEAETDVPFTLCVNGTAHEVPRGRSLLALGAAAAGGGL
ncbi:MAG: hypothetical protein ILM98_03095 [Kiritimatiellae bacterium]|nr:hypothetical protein [Kiritimatiellia bacterium]